jgi:transposase InsO family protein
MLGSIRRMLGSMGQVGSAGDNAAMESFFSLLQKNVLNRQTWDTREQLRIAIITWIERTYPHRRRRQVALGRLTPVEYETIMTQPLNTPPNRCHLFVLQTRLGGC